MNDQELDKAARLYRLLARREADDDAFIKLTAISSNFAEFRIRLLLDSALVPEAADVVGHWMDLIRREASLLPLNDAMHRVEQLSLAQAQLERRIQDLDAQLLEHMRKIDGVTDSLAQAHRESQELRQLLSRYRGVVIAIGERAEIRPESAHV